MSTIAELKAKLQSLNRRTQKPQDLWKPKDEHDVRCLKPPKADDPMPTRAFHYNIGDAISILCPKVNFGDDCAVCDYADRLRQWKDEKGRDKPEKVRKEDWEVFKKVQAVEKVFVPMIERLEEGRAMSDPKWWGLTKNQAEQLLKPCTEGERLLACGVDPKDENRALDAIFSATKAFDFHVSFRKPGEKGNAKTFTQVVIDAKYTPTPLTGDKKKDAELSTKIKPIDEVFPRVPSQEVETALRKFLNAEAEPQKPEGGEERYAGNSPEDARKSGTRKIDEAFEDLVGEGK